MGGYLGHPKMQESYHPEEFVGIVIGNLTRAIQVSPFSFFCFSLELNPVGGLHHQSTVSTLS